MADKAVFDMDVLLQSTCDDHDLARQIVGVFLNDIPVQLKDLNTALATGDVKSAERVAHSIKGAAATVGGEMLRECAMECEDLAREGDLDAVGTRTDDLNGRYESLKTALLDAGFTAE